ncbi:hypothetical protein GCM10012278_62670 [Nonomuraea glycinis]|uniref:Uncharacterized protein n=1 Tax=Nonomuraea glycinis TaxID=2047744 RepID=A0A918AD27_9ACTN|nr:hypothetical protein GCM10012278_62670 [Nonomuraea glycinis]
MGEGQTPWDKGQSNELTMRMGNRGSEVVAHGLEGINRFNQWADQEVRGLMGDLLQELLSDLCRKVAESLGVGAAVHKNPVQLLVCALLGCSNHRVFARNQSNLHWRVPRIGAEWTSSE